MGFYGIHKDYDPAIRQLNERLEILVAKRQQRRQQQIELVLPKDINIRTKDVGQVIVQAIVGAQFVVDCIGSYFKRQFVHPLLSHFQPITQIYTTIPLALTTAKTDLAKSFSFRQRWWAATLLSSVACVSSLHPNFNIFAILSRPLLTFGLCSWLFIPELNPKWLYLFRSI